MSDFIEFMNDYFNGGIKFEHWLAQDKVVILFDLSNLKKKARRNKLDFENDYISAIDDLPDSFKEFLRFLTRKMRENGFFKTQDIVKNLESRGSYGFGRWEILLDLTMDEEFDEIASAVAGTNHDVFFKLMKHKRFNTERIRIETQILVDMIGERLCDAERTEKVCSLIKESQKAEFDDDMREKVSAKLRDLAYNFVLERFGYSGFEYYLNEIKDVFDIWKSLISDAEKKSVSSMVVENLIKKLKVHMRNLKGYDSSESEFYDSKRDKLFRIFSRLFELFESDNEDWKTLKATFAILKIGNSNGGSND